MCLHMAHTLWGLGRTLETLIPAESEPESLPKPEPEPVPKPSVLDAFFKVLLVVLIALL